MTTPASFTLQLLHYYGESGLLGVETAPIMGALIDRFDDTHANTLVLAEGDSYIPGPWLLGGADPSLNAVSGIGRTALGRPDIAIMNAFGTDASALGNHEFDLGSPVLQAALTPGGGWVGAQFPLITANLDFSADLALRGLADAGLGGTATNAFAGQEGTAIKGKIAPYAVVTVGGERVGLVGITTYELLSKSSPNGTVPKDDGDPSTSDLQEVAGYLQSAVDLLTAAGVNKIVMLDQLDTIERNKVLAPLVSGIDVMIAGGGHERMGDSSDTPVGFNGHSANFIADAYPIVTAGADGSPVLIVTTDTEYSYLGRLVVDFDASGTIDLGSLDIAINGAYASSEAILQAAYDTTQSADQIIAGSSIGSQVMAITDAIQAVIEQKDGTVWGYTEVYLEGDRALGRTQEVNFGNLSADANLYAARLALGDDDGFLTSLKNGGGIRASIGSIAENGDKIPPISNPAVGKPSGGISSLDIENALRFDNKLMVFDTTPQGLKNILEFAAGLSDGPFDQDGGYMQIGGIRVSYDPTPATPADGRVKSIALTDPEGTVVAPVFQNGTFSPEAPETIQMVSLSFTANGGDMYPIKANANNFRYLLVDGSQSNPVDESLDFTAGSTYASVGLSAIDILGEQKALEDYLSSFHATPNKAYAEADTPPSEDERIQNLDLRSDNVFPPVGGGGVPGKGDDSSSEIIFPLLPPFRPGDVVTVVNGDEADNELIGNDDSNYIRGQAGKDTILGFGGNDDLRGNQGDDVISAGQGDDNVLGGLGNDTINGNSGNDVVRGGYGDDLVQGGLGDDALNGNAGTDVLLGGAGDDVVYGGQGDDRLNGNSGDDLLIGGSGSDVFLLSQGDDTILDFSIVEGDRLAILSGQPFSLAESGNDLIIFRAQGNTTLLDMSLSAFTEVNPIVLI